MGPAESLTALLERARRALAEGASRNGVVRPPRHGAGAAPAHRALRLGIAASASAGGRARRRFAAACSPRASSRWPGRRGVRRLRRAAEEGAAFRRAVALAPFSAAASRQLSVTLRRRGRATEAEGLAAAAVRLAARSAVATTTSAY